MSVVSEFHVFPNRHGRKMAAYWDHVADITHDAPFVILAPKFGESKKNNLQAGYYLARNGLNVFRFDHTDHPGESEGHIADYTFKGATEDILDVIDYLEEAFRAREVILMANSMSVRPAIRAAARDQRIARLISLVGMVNFQHTARAVYQEDMVDLHRRGQSIGNTDILGHEVNVSRFLTGTIEENMHDLSGTLSDIRDSSADLFFICGERDEWVDHKDLHMLEKSRDGVEILWVPGAMHEIRENPRSANLAFQEAVFACKHGRFSAIDQDLGQVAKPDKSAVLEQNRREREKLRLANPLLVKEAHFWKDYLRKYGVLEQVTDFQEYVSLTIDLLGPIRAEDCILDAGCGNGLVGSFLQSHLHRKHERDPEFQPVYFGLDLTESGLSEALTRHSHHPRSSHPPSLEFQYLKYDLEAVGRGMNGRSIELPFDSATFDKICCSLLISYLRRPAVFLKECHRLLKPEGRIVISSMKPYCDLSSLYTKLVQEDRNTAVVEGARNLLSAAGSIRLKEEQGHYTFFSRTELSRLAEEAGFREIRSFRSFGNQANLIAATR